MKYIKLTGIWMIKNYDLLSIIIVTWFTWIGRPDITQSVSAFLRVPDRPLHLFEENSSVYDFPGGNLSSAIKQFKHADFIIIYFYTHWDSESLQKSKTFESISDGFKSKYVSFISVNCWDKTSECQQMMKIDRYPRLSAYIVQRRKNIEFMDEIEPNSVYKFIEDLRYPFYVPFDDKELYKLLIVNDAVLVFAYDSKSPDFNKYINVLHEASSIRHGDNKNLPKVAFVLLSHSDESVQDCLKQYNIELHQPALLSFNSDKRKQRVEYNSNITLTTEELLDFIDKHAQSKSLFRSVRDFYPSGRKSQILSNFLSDGGVTVMHVYDRTKHYYLKQTLERIQVELAGDIYSFCPYINDHHITIWEAKLEMMLDEFHGFYNCSSKYINKAGYCNPSRVTNFLSDPDYLLVDINKLKDQLFDYYWTFCGRRHLFNRELNFIRLHSHDNYQLLHNLALSHNTTNVIVVDFKNEKLHKMEEEISLVSLDNLLSQIMLNNLSIYYKSSLNNFIWTNSSNDSLIRPIDLYQLELELADPSSDLIVFYYTPWCGYCTAVFDLLIMTAQYFHQYTQIHFTSIDTFANELPTKYIPEFVPALIMCPQNNKDNCQVYPTNHQSELTLSHLIRFILNRSGNSYLSLDQHQQHASPSTIKSANNKVKCNQICIKQARATVHTIFNQYQTLNQINRNKLAKVKQQLLRLCYNQDYYWPHSKLPTTNSWQNYRTIMQNIAHQSNLILQLNQLKSQQLFLTDKLKQFSKLDRAFRIFVKTSNISSKETSAVFNMKHLVNHLTSLTRL